MLTSDGIPAVMNVTPTNNNGNNGNGMWGGDWASWIILFLIFGLFGGWGGYGGFGGFGGGAGGAGTEAVLQRQLDTQSIIGKLDGVTQGLCDGFYATNNAINGLGMNMMQGFNAANIANLQATNAIQSQLANCCCETREAIQGVNYNMATNTCALQNTMNNNTRDVIDNANSNTRAILDYLCQDKIETLRDALAAERNVSQGLRTTIDMANQNNVLKAAMDANTAEILRRTGAECPTAAYIVQPPQPVSFRTNCSGQAVFGGNCGNCGNCNPCGGY